MAVKIRLLRMGKIRNPQYRIVVADSRTKRDGRAIEYIGIYQPKEEPSLIEVIVMPLMLVIESARAEAAKRAEAAAMQSRMRDTGSSLRP